MSTATIAPRLWADNLTRERPSCVQSDTGWNCSCPTGAAPTPVIPAGTATRPAFRVCFEAVDPPQPGAVRVVSTGRTSFVDQPCEERGEGTAGDAAATVSVVVALSSALPTPPMAALTVGRRHDNVSDADPGEHGSASQRPDGQFGGPSPRWPIEPCSLPCRARPSGRSYVDERRRACRACRAQQLFTSLFRMHPDTYKQQPAAVRARRLRRACSDELRQALQGNPAASSGSMAT